MHDDDLISECIEAILPVNGRSSFSCAFALTCEKVKGNVIGTMISLSSVTINEDMVNMLKERYKTDPWCQNLVSAARSTSSLVEQNRLRFLGSQLLVSQVEDIHEWMFWMAHDSLGHFGFEKAYNALRWSYYWPKMHCDLEKGYILGCLEYHGYKSLSGKPMGPLHPLPVPDSRGDSIAMDFVSPLPEDEGYNYILTLTDRLH